MHAQIVDDISATKNLSWQCRIQKVLTVKKYSTPICIMCNNWTDVVFYSVASGNFFVTPVFDFLPVTNMIMTSLLYNLCSNCAPNRFRNWISKNNNNARFWFWPTKSCQQMRLSLGGGLQKCRSITDLDFNLSDWDHKKTSCAISCKHLTVTTVSNGCH